MKPVIGLVVPLPLGKPELPAFSVKRVWFTP